MRNVVSSPPAGPASRSASSTQQLPVGEPEAGELGPRSLGERLGTRTPLPAELVGEGVVAHLRLGRCGVCSGERIGPGRQSVELCAGRARPLDELVSGRGREPALGVADHPEPLLDVLEPSRLRLERRQERAKARRRLAQPNRGVGQVCHRVRELRHEPGDRIERALGPGGEIGCPFGVGELRRERLRGGEGRVGEPGRVPQPLALGPQSLLASRLEPVGRGDESLELGGAGFGSGRARGELCAIPARGLKLTPGHGRRPSPRELFLPGEGIERLELVGRTGEAPLLELAGHRDEALDECRNVLPRCRPAPGVRAAAAVGEHAPGRDEPRLPFGSQLGDGRESIVVEQPVREVELGLDVGLGGGRADVAGRSLRSEQQPDRLGENRLARSGLARDHVEARPERQVGLADQDEILDVEPPKH